MVVWALVPTQTTLSRSVLLIPPLHRSSLSSWLYCEPLIKDKTENAWYILLEGAWRHLNSTKLHTTYRSAQSFNTCNVLPSTSTLPQESTFYARLHCIQISRYYQESCKDNSQGMPGMCQVTQAVPIAFGSPCCNIHT